MLTYRMDHLFSYTGTLAPPEIIGPVPEGIRGNFYITGGDVTGPSVRGKLRPVGADWFLLRPDGIGHPDVRLMIETHDGALIYMTYVGFGDAGVDGYANMLRGEMPATLPLKHAPTLRTAHPAYEWLHREFLVAIGAFDLASLSASYDVYALR